MEKTKITLPRYVALKSKYNNKYLRYVYEDVEVHGFNQFSGEELVSPYTKYEVEVSKKYKGLVHVKSCYNNKYWRRWSENHWWIVAGADEPKEDRSSWSSTLFEPFYAIDKNSAQTAIRLRHVQLEHYACLWRLDPPYGDCLFGGSESPDGDNCDVCIVIDWDSLLILPKYIAFKNNNNHYLTAKTIEGNSYLMFTSTNITNRQVWNKVFTASDGSVRIRSDYFKKFWKCCTHNFIWAEANNDANTANSLFWPTRVENNVVALRNLGNNNICKRLIIGSKTNCINASFPTITKEAHLEVEELVLSRKIYNVNFCLMEARIYNKSVIVIASKEVSNMAEEPITEKLCFSYQDTKSHTWKCNLSFKLGVKLTIESGIPIISDGLVEIPEDSKHFLGEYEWGTIESTITKSESEYTVTVPPRSRVRVSIVGTLGSYDVPFSYSQQDTLMDEKVIDHNMDDGVFTGVNCYKFEYETKEEKLML